MSETDGELGLAMSFVEALKADPDALAALREAIRGEDGPLVSLVDAIGVLESAGMTDAAHLLRREFPS